jgi:hypothetical protein
MIKGCVMKVFRLATPLFLSTALACFASQSTQPKIQTKPQEGAENVVQIPPEFKNKELLENIKWTDPVYIQAITSGWDKYTGSQYFENAELVGGAREVLYTKEMQEYGAAFSATLRRFKSDGVFEFVFVSKGDDALPKDFREKFMNYAVKAWGAPLKDIDTSLTDKEGGTDSHDVEWVLGNTQVKFTFSGVDMYGRRISSLCALIVTQNGKYPPLKDLIPLKCEGQSRLFGFDDSAETMPELPFIVLLDLNDNRVLRRDKSILGKITQVSDDYFIAEWQDKDTKTGPAPILKANRLTIDRKLGTYEWKGTLVANKSQGKISSGSCEKVNFQMEPKF